MKSYEEEYRVFKLLKQRKGISFEEVLSETDLNYHHVQKIINNLKSSGFEINSRKGKIYLESYPELIEFSYINERLKERNLKTRVIAKRVMIFEKLDSTNDYIYTAALNNQEEGLVIVAGVQTGGKGRENKKWYSPAGGLWLSSVLRPNIEPGNLHRLTLMASLSVAQVLKSMFQLPARIKWPNDVVIGDNKICGILTEAKISGFRTEFVVIGIGLNVNISNFPRGIKNATSVRLELGYDVNLYDVFERLIINLDKNYMISLTDVASICESIKENSSLLNRDISIVLHHRTLAGRCVGFDTDGGLLLEVSGKVHKVMSGTVINS